MTNFIITLHISVRISKKEQKLAMVNTIHIQEWAGTAKLKLMSKIYNLSDLTHNNTDYI